MTREEAIRELKIQFVGEYDRQREAKDVAIEALEQQPCEDTISRQAVINWLTNEWNGLVTSVFDGIKNLPPVTPLPKTGWIPVSERLPEDRRSVLVTAYWHETYQVMMASYFGDGLWWCVPFNNCGEHMQRLNPKAWMPLPERYAPNTNDGNMAESEE